MKRVMTVERRASAKEERSQKRNELIDENVYNRTSERLGAGANGARNAAKTRGVETEAKRESQAG